MLLEKSNARTRTHSESFAKAGYAIEISHQVLSECGESSNRFCIARCQHTCFFEFRISSLLIIMRLFLCGDVMTGRGIDQALPHPVNPVLYEPYVRDARDYIELAEKAHGPILR